VTGFSSQTAPLSESERRTEVEQGEAAISDATGISPRPFFRPPFGDYDDLLLDQLPRWGYTQLVMWTVDSLGWNGLSATEITGRCLDSAEPGTIYLFHVGSASEDYAALPAIIEGMRERGLEPVSISEFSGG
jgi:peptidoglycan/xylan/chitin deacetylase (PgdA/CDA1 family)